MVPMLLLVLVAGLIFILGVLCGGSLADHLYEARSRRQAARQRQLNDEFRVLRERQDVGSQRERLNRLSTGVDSSHWPRGPVPH